MTLYLLRRITKAAPRRDGRACQKQKRRETRCLKIAELGLAAASKL